LPFSPCGSGAPFLQFGASLLGQFAGAKAIATVKENGPVPGTTSFIAKKGEVQQNWYTVDATDQIVGRLASQIAVVLMGKHRPGYTAHVDTGEFVIVTNADKVIFTGNKWDNKRYTWYTGYTRLRSESARERLKKQPDMVLREAVRRMLPKTKLGRQMLSKLKVYTGSEHHHQAQQPKPFAQAFGNADAS